MERVNQPPLSMSTSEEQEAALFRSLPPGYRFKPKDEELVEFYLKRKIQNKKLPPNIFRDVDLYNYDPETLTALNNNASSNGVLTEWFFFTPRERKYANGNRPRRCAGYGFWKATGKDKVVFSCGEKVGLKKTLVFHKGKAPKGDKTNWTMHEYVLIKAPARQRLGKEDMRLDDCVLCRVYQKLNKVQRPPCKYAIVVQNEGQVLENGNPSVAQKEDFDADANADALNMPMSQQTSLMPASHQQCDYMLQQYSEPVYPIQGHNPATPMPLSSVGPSNWSHLPPMQQQQFSNVCPSNRSHLQPMQQQQFSNVCPSNWPHLLPMQQQQFSNVCPSMSPMQQQQRFDAISEQNPEMFCNFIPTHTPLPPLPLNQQSRSQVPLQHPFSHVGPGNLPHLTPAQQQLVSVDKPIDSAPLQHPFSHVGPGNLPTQQQLVSGDKAIDSDSIVVDDPFIEDLDLSDFLPL